MNRIEVNVLTGESQTIDLTTEEIAAANAATEAEVAKTNAQYIDKRQLYKQLVAIDKWDALKTALSSSTALTDYYESAWRFRIDDAEVIAMATALGVADLQGFFNAAAEL